MTGRWARNRDDALVYRMADPGRFGCVYAAGLGTVCRPWKAVVYDSGRKVLGMYTSTGEAKRAIDGYWAGGA